MKNTSKKFPDKFTMKAGPLTSVDYDFEWDGNQFKTKYIDCDYFYTEDQLNSSSWSKHTLVIPEQPTIKSIKLDLTPFILKLNKLAYASKAAAEALGKVKQAIDDLEE